MDQTLLTLEQLAERLNRPVGTVRYWRHLGIGPRTFKLGRRVVALESDVEQWIAQERDRQAAS